MTTLTGIDIPMEKLTMEQYAAITVKNTPSQIPLKWYDNGDWPLRTVTVWPIPQRCQEALAWQWQPLLNFNDLDTEINFPPGYERALRFALAVELANEFGKEVPAVVSGIARQSKGFVKRMNSKPQIMVGDIYIASKRPSLFNYLIGDTVGSAGLF